MSEILKDFSVAALVRVIEANLWEFAAYWGQSPQVELHDDADMMWYATSVAHPLLNAVVRTQLAPGEIDVRIEATLNYFKSRKLPMMWWAGPATRPADLGEHLEACGLTQGADVPGMAVDLQALKEDLPVPSDLIIERAGDAKTLKEWLHPFAIGFGFPDFALSTFFDSFASLGLGKHLPLHHYVGWLKGEPVASSSVLLGAGVAGIYNVATVPHARGQGIGAALTLVPLCDARDVGYRIGILHSSPMGFNVYRRMGFQEYCRLRTYILAVETDQG